MNIIIDGIKFRIISSLALFFVLIPENKFSLFYGIKNIVMFLTTSVSLNFLTLEFLIGVTYILGNILIFYQKTLVVCSGYLLAIVGLLIHLYYHGISNSFLFWIPLVIFGLSAFYVVWILLKVNINK